MTHHWFLLTWDLWPSDSISATEHFTNVNEIADAPNNTKDIGPFCVEFASKQSTTVHFSLNSRMYFCISSFELSIYIHTYNTFHRHKLVTGCNPAYAQRQLWEAPAKPTALSAGEVVKNRIDGSNQFFNRYWDRKSGLTTNAEVHMVITW